MAARKTTPAVVAELGRPETPEETAARKAENSRKRRSRQTVVNLLLSILASLVVVLFLVLVVVRPDPAPRDPINVPQVAAQSQADASADLAAPQVPPGWTANAARLETVAGVKTWYVGYITAQSQFIALNQGIDANPSWIAELVRGASAERSQLIGGVDWEVYDRRDADNPGNVAYGMVARGARSTYVLTGTASDDEFEAMAESIAPDILAETEGTE